MVSRDEARKELARRELARRRGEGQPSVVGDVAASGASGMARGALDLLGLPGTVGDVLDAGGRYALRKGYELATGEAPSAEGGIVERFFAGPTQEVQEQFGSGSPLSGAALKGYASDLTGGATEYEPQTTAGEYAGTVGEFIPGAAAFGGLNPGNLARFGVLPGLASEGAGQLTEGSAIEPYARLGAALVAPALPAMASRAISPISVAPERLAAAEVLKREGVRPTAGQVSGSNRLRYMESEMGGNKAAQMLDDQAEAFTSAAMRKAGGSGRATPENMKALNDRLSKGFNEISARNTLKADKGLMDDMNAAIKEYGTVLESEQRKIVSNIAQDIVDRFKSGKGTLSGKEYQTIRSRLSKRSNNAGKDTELGNVFRDLRNALDRAMDRSIKPEDAGKWAQLRREYGNMKTLERAATGAGENAALGLISPARLRMAATSGRQGAYARGEGDFSELSRAGNALMTPLPNSGTASRLSARNLGSSVSTLLGSGAGAATAGAPGAIMGALAGSMVPAVAGRGLMSRPVQSYLLNQAAPQMSFADPRYRAVIAALIGQSGPGVAQALGGR